MSHDFRISPILIPSICSFSFITHLTPHNESVLLIIYSPYSSMLVWTKYIFWNKTNWFHVDFSQVPSYLRFKQLFNTSLDKLFSWDKGQETKVNNKHITT